MKTLSKSIALGLAFGAATMTAAFATNLTSEQIEEQIIGKRMQAEYLGAPMTVLYDPSGDVQVTAPDMSGTGTWSMTEGSFCVNMTTGPNLGETCMTIEARGDGLYSTSNGMSLTVVSR